MNTFPAYRVQLYIENDWQVRDERAIHSINKVACQKPAFPSTSECIEYRLEDTNRSK